MPVEQLSDIYDPGTDILGSSQDSRGVILVQTGDVVTGNVECDNAEWWQPVGFASRPAKAEKGSKACQTVVLTGGSTDVCLGQRDARCSLPAGLGEGCTALYAGGPNNTGTGQIRLSDDGSTATISLQLRDGNTENGTLVEIQVKSDKTIVLNVGGNAKITIDGATGQISLGATASDKVTLAAPLEGFLTQLLVSLATGSNGGGAIVWGTPLPSLPTLGSNVVNVQP